MSSDRLASALTIADIYRRAHVLKQMLEGYLNQSTKSIPNLQQQANAIAKEAMNQATDGGGVGAGLEKSLPDRTKTSGAGGAQQQTSMFG